ncbi:MAG: nucleotide exchange factor GrpE [Desulfobulbus sp.]
MAHEIWSRFVRRLTGSAKNGREKSNPTDLTLGDVHGALGEEFRGIRKMLRKQGAAMEELLSRRDAPQTTAITGKGDNLLQLAVAFFHLDQSLRSLLADSPAHREAVALFWLQLERGLDEIGFQMIREQSVPFDARLHRAVLSRGTGAVEWMVVEVLEPGFIYGETVRTPAKVILAPQAAGQKQIEECQ